MRPGPKAQLSVQHVEGRARPWLVNIPASLSETGKRKREFFESKRLAEARIRGLSRISSRESSRSDLAKALEPHGATLWEAVNFFITMQSQFQPALDEHGATIEEAVRDFLHRQRERAQSVEFCKAFAEFQEAKAHRRSRTKDDYRNVSDRMGAHFKGKLLSDITAREIDAAISKECPGDHGRRKFMAVLKTLFNWSIRRDYLSKNPILKLDPVELRPSQKPILTNDQVNSLLTKCTNEILPYYLFGLFCGIRPKELQRLDWEHVNIEERHVFVPGPASKTWEHRYVEISDNLLEWIELCCGEKLGRICPGDFGQKHRANYNRAGIAVWKQDVMRHTFASNHLAHFGNLDALLQAMGHRSSPQTLWRYYHKARTKSEARQFWSIRPSSRQKIVEFAKAG